MRICGLVGLLVMLAGFSAAQDTNFSTGPQYLLNGPPLFARSIATPSLSLSAPPPQRNSSEEAIPSTNTTSNEALPEFNGKADLLPVYYGDKNESVIEISSSEASNEATAPLPASITQTGVSAMVDMQILRQRGYGVMPSEVAAYWKAHKMHATHRYTNADIERLHAAAN